MHENENSCRIRGRYVCVKVSRACRLCVRARVCVNMERGAMWTAVCEDVVFPYDSACCMLCCSTTPDHTFC